MSRTILESYYGADGVETLEKTAQAKFIEKIAADYGHDISTLQPEQRQEFENLVLGDLQQAGLLEGEEKTAEPFEDDPEVQVEEDGKTHEDVAREMANVFADEVEKLAGAKTAGDNNACPVPSTDTPGQAPSWLSSLWSQAKELTSEGQGTPKLDKMAEARAYEMLKLAADIVEQDEGTDPLDDAVTLRSLEMMDDAGYDSDLVTEKVAQALEAVELEKQASDDEKKTYPISRFFSSPAALAGYAAAGGLGLSLIDGAGVGKGKAIRGLVGAGLGAGYGALAGSISRGAYLRGLRGRANMGQEGSSESERKLLEALKGKQV